MVMGLTLVENDFEIEVMAVKYMEKNISFGVEIDLEVDIEKNGIKSLWVIFISITI